jgi:predicted ATPase/class 3 adenylate cyclase
VVRLPSGKVTLLLTDIEGSTLLLQELGSRYRAVLDDHRRILEQAFASNDGVVVDREGDAFFCVFSSADDAVAAAQAAQHGLAAHEWPSNDGLAVRIGIHTGEPERHGDGYVGLDVHRAARVMSAAHGGQVLLTAATLNSLTHKMPTRDLGLHRLKDFDERQLLFQLLTEGLQADFPPLRTLERRPTNLPRPTTALVGRRREREELRWALVDDAVRLVTLTGSGGTGKTRLALEVARDLLDNFGHGVFFVSLAPAAAPEDVLPAVAEALALRLRPGQPAVELLADHLRGQALLVLDNFEHVAAAAPSVASLLEASPQLTVLATSRNRLRVRGEHVFRLEPLPVPAPRDRQPERLEQVDSVALFVERARAADEDFALTHANGRAVGQICRCTEGLPLALELAAARASILAPDELARRLGDRLALLTGGARDLPDRQQTLRATIDWSYGLLEPAVQVVFAQLAVFAGGCDLTAVAGVCTTEEPLEVLAALADANLVGAKKDAGETRFSMLETVREFARELFDRRDDRVDLTRRHAKHYLALAQSAADLYHSSAQQAVASVEKEFPNVHAALVWALENDPETGLRTIASLRSFFLTYGRYDQVRGELLERALESHGVSSGTRAGVALLTAKLAGHQGDWDAAGRYNDQALAFFRLSSNAEGIALCLAERGWNDYRRGDYEGAISFCGEAATLVRGAPRSRAFANSLNISASAEAALGRADVARALYLQGVEYCRASGNEHGLGSVLSSFGGVLLEQGAYEQARAALIEGLPLARKFSDREQTLVYVVNLGILALEQGRFEEALGFCREALTLSELLGHRYGTVFAFEITAALAAELGTTETAALLFTASGLLRENLQMPAKDADADFVARRLALVAAALGPEAVERHARVTTEDAFDAAFEFVAASEDQHEPALRRLLGARVAP